MKKITLLLFLVLGIVGNVASQNVVTENDIVGTWTDNFGIRYVFDTEKQGNSTGTVTVTGGVKGTYHISGDDVIVVINNMLMVGNKPLSNDKKRMVFTDNSRNRITLTRIEQVQQQQGKTEGNTISGRYYGSRTSYEFTDNNFSGIVGSTPMFWGTFTVSGDDLNLHITGGVDGDTSQFVTFKIIDANTIEIGGTFYRRR